MAIEFPSHLFRIRAAEQFTLQTLSFTSPEVVASGARVYGPVAQRWVAELEFAADRNVRGSTHQRDLGELDAFFAALDGQVQTFSMWPPHRKVTRGTAAGFTGFGDVLWDGGVTWDNVVKWASGNTHCTLLSAATAGSERIILAGLTANQVRSFIAGDMISIGGNLYMIVNDARSDSSGNCGVNVRPRLRKAEAAGARVDLYKPTGRFMLAGADAARIRYGVHIGDASMSVIEVPFVA